MCISLAISGTLVDTSLYEILEDIICERVHGTGHRDDKCKDTGVQTQLSSLMGGLQAAMMVPGLVLTVPYGALADRYGRVKILGLSLLGITLYMASMAVVCARPDVFSLKLIWLSPAFQVIGGGTMVANPMLYATVADIVTDEQRSSAFMYIGSLVMAGSLVARPITYLAMSRSAWFAMWLGIAWLGITTVLAFCIPETLNVQAAVETDPVAVETPPDGKSPVLRFIATARAYVTKTFKTIRWLFWEQRLVGFLLVGLTFETLGKLAQLVSPQYISKRYKLSYSKVNLLQSIDTVTVLVLLLCILPVAGHLLTTKLRLSAREKDLRLAQGSAVVAALGTLVIATADKMSLLVVGMVTFNLGGGYTYLLRGLMTSLVAGHSIGLLYSCIAFVDTIIFMVAPLLYAWLFNVGLGQGDAWIGLPYLVGGGILVAAAVLVGLIRASFVDDVGTGGEGDEEEGEAGEESTGVR
ncbi:major facilitator superfamily domain-containing protein [Cercophora newfieldiana]|uniref:Major facilitator superfamily domain-containing protein n=1 Tax=Cercophora newfieldiana TaxID=92897 RepID=A0AA40CP15_9PEZI|nr:major facilitator superfamily domain-containing protein [Cercophora newfieldiana]